MNSKRKLKKDECTFIEINGKRIICGYKNQPITGMVRDNISDYKCLAYIEDGLRHRLDGPAIIGDDCTFTFCYKDKFTGCRTQKEFNKYIKKMVFE